MKIQGRYGQFNNVIHFNAELYGDNIGPGRRTKPNNRQKS